MNWFNDINGITDEFHQYFASWARLEPRSRTDSSQGLEARIVDPLWMLARQWQFGEFRGEDNGSPVNVNVNYKVRRINQITRDVPVALEVWPPNGGGMIRKLPLEPVVECENIIWDWRFRVRAGQQFERFLRQRLGDRAAAVILKYRSEGYFPVRYPAGEDLTAADYETRSFLKHYSGKTIDGGKLIKAVYQNAAPPLPAELAAGVNAQDLENAYKYIKKWYEDLYTQPKPGQKSIWQSSKFDARFTASSQQGSAELIASGYHSGDPDWYAFDLQKAPSEESDEFTYQCLNPSTVGFPGKPHERWWTFEDRRIDLGNLETGATDTVKLLMMEFALVYTDDWFIVPVEVPAGSIVEIVSLTVKNVFGDESSIPIARNIIPNRPFDNWNLFSLTGNHTGNMFLVIPPPTGCREESPPAEEVHFMRDEGANLVFAVEHTVQNMLGNPVHGFEAYLERKERETPSPGVNPETNDPVGQRERTGNLPRYGLISPAPDNWIPYVPVNQGTNLKPVVRLRQALINRGGAAMEIKPLSRLLFHPDTGEALEWIDEESVPRTGVKLQLTKQRVRWIDGKTYVWVGRKAVTGRGEGSSGLKFDYLEYEK